MPPCGNDCEPAAREQFSTMGLSSTVKESSAKQISTSHLPCSPHESFGLNPQSNMIPNGQPTSTSTNPKARCGRMFPHPEKKISLRLSLPQMTLPQGLMDYLMPHGGYTQELPQKR